MWSHHTLHVLALVSNSCKISELRSWVASAIICRLSRTCPVKVRDFQLVSVITLNTPSPLFCFHTDISDIWARVSCFIERQMIMRKVKCKKPLWFWKRLVYQELWEMIYCASVRYFSFRSVFIVFKGVYISGLGTFTFTFDKVTPTFILTEKLCHTYGFKQKKRQCSGQNHRTNEK